MRCCDLAPEITLKLHCPILQVLKTPCNDLRSEKGDAVETYARAYIEFATNQISIYGSTPFQHLVDSAVRSCNVYPQLSDSHQSPSNSHCVQPRKCILDTPHHGQHCVKVDTYDGALNALCWSCPRCKSADASPPQSKHGIIVESFVTMYTEGQDLHQCTNTDGSIVRQFVNYTLERLVRQPIFQEYAHRPAFR